MADVTSPSPPIRTSLIGYGYVGRVFHAPLIRSIPGLALAVIGSSQPPEQVQETAPGTEVIADPWAAATAPDIDLVVIASPNDSHAGLAIAALSAGKHVVVDKPFTVSLSEARSVAAAAEKSGKILSVFQNRRFDSDFLTAEAAISSGRLGRLVQFNSAIDRYRPEAQDRWRERPGPGAGLWFDLGTHLADQALKLFGLPETVSVHVASQRKPGSAPDWFHAVLTYPGLHVILGAGCLVAGGSARFTLHGTAASFVKSGVDVQETQLRQGMAPGDLDWGIDLDSATLIDGASAEPEVMAAIDGDYRRYYLGIRDAIISGGPNPVTPAEAVALMALIEAGVVSASTGSAQTLALTAAERAAFQAVRGA